MYCIINLSNRNHCLISEVVKFEVFLYNIDHLLSVSRKKKKGSVNLCFSNGTVHINLR